MNSMSRTPPADSKATIALKQMKTSAALAKHAIFSNFVDLAPGVA